MSRTPYEAMRLFAMGLLEELEDEHSCTEVALYRTTLADIEAEAATPGDTEAVLPREKRDPEIGMALRTFGESIGEIGMREIVEDRELTDDELAAAAFLARGVVGHVFGVDVLATPPASGSNEQEAAVPAAPSEGDEQRRCWTILGPDPISQCCLYNGHDGDHWFGGER